MGGANKDEQTGELVPLYGAIIDIYREGRGAGAKVLETALNELEKSGEVSDPINAADPSLVIKNMTL